MTATNRLTFKIVKVTDKGQISLPMNMQREIGIKKGDELVLVRKGRRMILEKPERVVELLEDEFADLQSLTEESLGRIWLNKKEDVWDQYLKPRRR